MLRATAYLVLAALLLSTAFAIGGCGGDDDGNGTASGDAASNAADSEPSSGAQGASGAAQGKPVAKATFVKKANAICDQAVERVANLAFPVIQQETDGDGSERSQQEVEVELAKAAMAPELRREVRRIRALGIPKGDRRKVDAILAATLEVAKEAEQNPEAVIQSGSSAFDKPSRLASGYGIASCPYG